MAENVEHTDDGVEAILDLAHGDMRRVMNLLQSTSMSYGLIDESSVYLTSGAPLPANVDIIARSLFNDNFVTASKTVMKVSSLSRSLSSLSFLSSSLFLTHTTPLSP